jgi:hypothetical protein
MENYGDVSASFGRFEDGESAAESFLLPPLSAIRLGVAALCPPLKKESISETDTIVEEERT